MRPAAPLLLVGFAVACGAPQGDNAMSANEVAGALADLTIEPGLWEVSSAVTDVRAPNLPIAVRNRMIGPRSRLRHCITAAQAAQPSAGFFAGRGDGRCSYRDFAMAGGRLRGAMACAEPDVAVPVETVMAGRYGRDRYELRMEMRNPMPDGEAMRVFAVSRGRRIGPCEGESLK